MREVDPRKVPLKTRKMVRRATRQIVQEKLALKTAVAVFRIIWSKISPGAKIEVKKALSEIMREVAFAVDELMPEEAKLKEARLEIGTLNLVYALCIATKIPALKRLAREEKNWAMNRLRAHFQQDEMVLARILGVESKLRQPLKKKRRRTVH